MTPAEKRFHNAVHNLQARIRQAISEFERDTTEQSFCVVSRAAVEEQGIGD
jgi:plasmid replication initiation protein